MEAARHPAAEFQPVLLELPHACPFRLPGRTAALPLDPGTVTKVVTERLGHANIAITMDTYSHVLPGLDEQAAGQVARLILGAGSGDAS